MTVARYAPRNFADPDTKRAAIFHREGRPVTKVHPARRDELLVMYATGFGPTSGARVVSGMPAPAEPFAKVSELKAFFSDVRFRQAEVIVDWAGWPPGMWGCTRSILRVPGDHMRGEELPVTLRVGGVGSQTTGPVVPVVAVD